MSKKYKDRYLPVEVIIAATQGEAAAIQTVLKTYESYIRNKCIKTVYDERGLVYYGIDTDKKDFMERRLIHAVVENFRIYYIESYGHTILVHSKGKDFQLRMNIQDAAKQLPKRCFTAPHRCYLVNMEHILYTSSDEIMLCNGAKLPISRRKRQEFNQAFNTYLGR